MFPIPITAILRIPRIPKPIPIGVLEPPPKLYVDFNLPTVHHRPPPRPFGQPVPPLIPLPPPPFIR